MKKKRVFLLCCFLWHLGAESSKSDIVIFSYDRPLQLYALLESICLNVINYNEITIIYRANDTSYEQAYQKLQTVFKNMHFFKQSDNPYQDFKPLTLKAIQKSSCRYLLFAVDDIVVKDSVDLHQCIEALEKTGAYGFYLRLGKNLSYCFPYRTLQGLPPLAHVGDTIYSWIFSQGTFDWNYPHTVDMTLYRKQDVLKHFFTLAFTYPNTLECNWTGKAHTIMYRRGLCFEQSKVVNIPLNRVQPDFHSASMEISPQELLQIFNEGKKIDIRPLQKFANCSAHCEYIPTYIDRY